MKFEVFLWLGALLTTAVMAIPLSSQASSGDLMSRDDDSMDLDARTIYDDLYSRDLQLVDLDERSTYLYDRDGILDLYERRLAELEKRRGRGGGGIGAIVQLVGDVVTNLKNEPKRQGKFTQELAGKLCGLRPHFNWLVIKTEHKVQWDGARGKDWGHKHFELPLGWFGRTSGFEIYYGKGGKLERKGDGGWQNWAFCGKFKRDNDRFVTFFRP